MSDHEDFGAARFTVTSTARPLIVPFDIGTFGSTPERSEGQAVAYDPAADGIALFSAAHPTLPWYKLPLTWAAALSFNARCAAADALVWLAEKIGPFQYYGRDK